MDHSNNHSERKLTVPRKLQAVCLAGMAACGTALLLWGFGLTTKQLAIAFVGFAGGWCVMDMCESIANIFRKRRSKKP